jgi:rhodanese-related sulfurtransferase
LNELEQSVDSLKKYKQIGIVCRSGNRAEQAKTFLSSQGLSDVRNLGAWQNINCKK